MPATLSFLHTSPIHIPTFDALIKDQAPDIPVPTSSAKIFSLKPATKASRPN